MNLSDINNLTQSVADFQDVAQAVDALERAKADVADLMIGASDLALGIEDRVSSLFTLTDPISCEPASWLYAADSLVGVQQPSTLSFEGLLDEYRRVQDGISAVVAEAKQVFDGYQHLPGSIATAVAEAKQTAGVAEFLTAPLPIFQDSEVLKTQAPAFDMAEQIGRSRLEGLMSGTDSVVGLVSSAAETARVALDWKPALVRSSPPPEDAFTTRLTGLEWALYSAIRPGILSVANQISREFEIQPKHTFVDYMGTLFELDFDLYPDPDLGLRSEHNPGFDIDIETPITEDSSVTDLPKLRRRLPETNLRPLFNTEVQRHSLISREQCVRVAKNQWVITIVGGTISGIIVVIVKHYVLGF